MTIYYFDFGGTISNGKYRKKDILKDKLPRKALREKYLNPKAFGMIQKLKSRGFTLGIITNTNCTYIQVIKILKKLGIRSYFKNVIVSCKSKEKGCYFKKPNRIIFDYARSLHPRAKKFVYIGNDYENDFKYLGDYGWDAKLI